MTSCGIPENKFGEVLECIRELKPLEEPLQNIVVMTISF